MAAAPEQATTPEAFPCSVEVQLLEGGGPYKGHFMVFNQILVKLVKIRPDGWPDKVMTFPRERVKLVIEDPTLAERNKPLLQRFNELQTQVRPAAAPPQAPPPQPPAPSPAPEQSQTQTLDQM